LKGPLYNLRQKILPFLLDKNCKTKVQGVNFLKRKNRIITQNPKTHLKCLGTKYLLKELSMPNTKYMKAPAVIFYKESDRNADPNICWQNLQIVM
jgi:hypothetical protein